MILTNRQLLDVLRVWPTSGGALARVDGIGKAKVVMCGSVPGTVPAVGVMPAPREVLTRVPGTDPARLPPLRLDLSPPGGGIVDILQEEVEGRARQLVVVSP